jgi:hypothetical protein
MTEQNVFQPGQLALCRGRGNGPVVVFILETVTVHDRRLYQVQSVNNPAAKWLAGPSPREGDIPSSRSPQSGRKARRRRLETMHFPEAD